MLYSVYLVCNIQTNPLITTKNKTKARKQISNLSIQIKKNENSKRTHIPWNHHHHWAHSSFQFKMEFFFFVSFHYQNENLLSNGKKSLSYQKKQNKTEKKISKIWLIDGWMDGNNSGCVWNMILTHTHIRCCCCYNLYVTNSCRSTQWKNLSSKKKNEQKFFHYNQCVCVIWSFGFSIHFFLIIIIIIIYDVKADKFSEPACIERTACIFCLWANMSKRKNTRFIIISSGSNIIIIPDILTLNLMSSVMYVWRLDIYIVRSTLFVNKNSWLWWSSSSPGSSGFLSSYLFLKQENRLSFGKTRDQKIRLFSTCHVAASFSFLPCL